MKKKLISRLLIAGIIIFGIVGLLFFPMRTPPPIEDSIVIERQQMDGTFQTYHIQPGSDAFDQLCELLSGQTYHISLLGLLHIQMPSDGRIYWITYNGGGHGIVYLIAQSNGDLTVGYDRRLACAIGLPGSTRAAEWLSAIDHVLADIESVE